jgi:asparagine synthase (glutamine-hydrolysing)
MCGGEIVSVAVSVQPYQFIGYWRYEEHDEVEAVWHRVLASTPQMRVQMRQGKIDSDSIDLFGNWAIAYIGAERLSETIPGEGIITTIFACGRRYLPGDAWVRVQDGQFVLGREAFGRVPLYWTQIGQVVWFATQLQLLLPVVTPQVSIPALYGYACFSYIPTPLTPVEQIAAIPAGTQLT